MYGGQIYGSIVYRAWMYAWMHACMYACILACLWRQSFSLKKRDFQSAGNTGGGDIGRNAVKSNGDERGAVRVSFLQPPLRTYVYVHIPLHAQPRTQTLIGIYSPRLICVESRLRKRPPLRQTATVSFRLPFPFPPSPWESASLCISAKQASRWETLAGSFTAWSMVSRYVAFFIPFYLHWWTLLSFSWFPTSFDATCRLFLFFIAFPCAFVFL